MARRVFLLAAFAIFMARDGGNSKYSFLAIFLSSSAMTVSFGAGTRTCRQRERSGYMTLERLSQLAMILQLGMYVSMVRRSEAYAVWES